MGGQETGGLVLSSEFHMAGVDVPAGSAAEVAFEPQAAKNLQQALACPPYAQPMHSIHDVLRVYSRAEEGRCPASNAGCTRSALLQVPGAGSLGQRDAFQHPPASASYAEFPFPCTRDFAAECNVRPTAVERTGKRLVYVLTKVDLILPQQAADWMQVLGPLGPVVCVQASCMQFLQFACAAIP